VVGSVADPHHVDADPDSDPACQFDSDSSFHFDADSDPSFQIKAQNLEMLISIYILACHLQIYTDPDPGPAYRFNADPDPDPAYRFEADPDPDPTFQFDADPDPQHCRGGRLGWQDTY
jgi:hypothetical protein